MRPELEEQLQKITNLPDDWDGYGSPKFSPEVVQLARDTLQRLEELQAEDEHPEYFENWKWSIVPSGGRILICLDNPDAQRQLTIYILEDLSVEWLLCEEGGVGPDKNRDEVWVNDLYLQLSESSISNSLQNYYKNYPEEDQ